MSKNEMSIVFSNKEISILVDDHLRADRFGPRKRFDPVDDLSRLMFYASELPGACEEPLKTNGEPLVKLTLHSFLDFAADLLFARNPSVSWDSWRALANGILHKRHAGSMVRFRKRPALESRVDATKGRMSYKELKAKHPHLCRSRLYAILSEARKGK